MDDEWRVWWGFWIGAFLAAVSGGAIHSFDPSLLNLASHSIIAGLTISLGVAIGYVAEARAEYEKTQKELTTLQNFNSRFIPSNFRQERVDASLRALASAYEERAKDVDDFLRGGLKKFPGKEDESREEMRQRYDGQRDHLDKLARVALEHFRQVYDLAKDADDTYLVLEERDPTCYLPKSEKNAPAA